MTHLEPRAQPPRGSGYNELLGHPRENSQAEVSPKTEIWPPGFPSEGATVHCAAESPEKYPFPPPPKWSDPLLALSAQTGAFVFLNSLRTGKPTAGAGTRE